MSVFKKTKRDHFLSQKEISLTSKKLLASLKWVSGNIPNLEKFFFEKVLDELLEDAPSGYALEERDVSVLKKRVEAIKNRIFENLELRLWRIQDSLLSEAFKEVGSPRLTEDDLDFLETVAEDGVILTNSENRRISVRLHDLGFIRIEGLNQYSITSKGREALSRSRTASKKNAARFTFPRNFYLPSEIKNEPPYIPVGTDLAIWTYESKGALYAIAFAAKQQKPLWHYRFRNEAERLKRIDETIESRKYLLQKKQQDRLEKKQFQHSFKVGDILVSSWGYEQTNINFYEVTKVIGKQIEIREISKKVVREERGADYVMPIPGRYVDSPMRKTPSRYNTVKISSHQSASKWDGKPEYQTASGYGH